MNPMILLDPAMLPYLAALSLAVVLALLSGLSLGVHGSPVASHTHVPHGHLPHVHLPHVHLPHTHVGAGHDSHGQHDQGNWREGAGSPAEAGVLQKALGTGALGHVPLMLVLQALVFLWGLLGIASNLTLAGSGLPLAAFGWLTFAVATVGSLFLTRLLLIPLARFTPPPIETYVSEREDLIGRPAVLAYRIDAGRKGIAHVRDAQGNLHQVMVELAEPATVPAGTELLLVGFTPGSSTFSAMVSPLAAATAASNRGHQPGVGRENQTPVQERRSRAPIHPGRGERTLEDRIAALQEYGERDMKNDPTNPGTAAAEPAADPNTTV